MSMDAETTGNVLARGTVFEAAAVVTAQGGVEFVELQDGEGWVFASKGATVILQRVDGTDDSKQMQSLLLFLEYSTFVGGVAAAQNIISG
jgi:hypothetical protein